MTVASHAIAQTGSLPSWNEGKAKQSIVNFVKRVITPGKHFVPEAERIATFNNGRHLWAEHPMYFQLAFALDRVETLAPQHPVVNMKDDWKTILRRTKLIKQSSL